MLTREEYRNSSLVFNNQGIFYQNVDIMNNWEAPHIKGYIFKYLMLYKPKTVLEIGFGRGYTSSVIQAVGVTKHVIVEAHPQVFQLAQTWASGKPNVELIYGFVEDIDYPSGVDFIWDDRHMLSYYGDEFLERIPHTHYHRFLATEMLQMDDKEYLSFLMQLRGESGEVI